VGGDLGGRSAWLMIYAVEACARAQNLERPILSLQSTYQATTRYTMGTNIFLWLWRYGHSSKKQSLAKLQSYSLEAYEPGGGNCRACNSSIFRKAGLQSKIGKNYFVFIKTKTWYLFGPARCSARNPDFLQWVGQSGKAILNETLLSTKSYLVLFGQVRWPVFQALSEYFSAKNASAPPPRKIDPYDVRLWYIFVDISWRLNQLSCVYTVILHVYYVTKSPRPTQPDCRPSLRGLYL